VCSLARQLVLTFAVSALCSAYLSAQRAAAVGPIRIKVVIVSGWAFHLTQHLSLTDSDSLRKSRARFAGFPNAPKPPFVARGDVLSASTFWHGSKMDEWANAWTRYNTASKGNYIVAAMEDSGTLQALTFLSQAKRVDFGRVLVLRTVSNYDREAPGVTAAESLQEMVSGNYSAYMPALAAAQIVGDKVVRDLVEHGAVRESAIPHVP
jgi:purine nucleoside permease